MIKPPLITLSSAHSTLVLDAQEDAARVVYWGKALKRAGQEQTLKRLAIRQESPSCAAEERGIDLTPTDASGFLGHSGLQAHRDGHSWTIYPVIESVIQDNDHSAGIVARDPHNGIKLTQHLNLDPNSGVLSASTQITNEGTDALTMNDCAAATLPVPSHLEQLLAFEGRWAQEFHLQEVDRFTGSFVRENRCGRSSHDSFPGLIVKGKHTSETQGEAYGFHLGWSGNHRLHSEVLSDGRGYVQMGELLFPGEIILAPGESYDSPTLFAAYSDAGLNALSQQFHRYVRHNLRSEYSSSRPRPVHYNTWEALYFDHRSETLSKLAKEAADIGAERFVLDDGWFKGRRGERAGLGDWTVDEAIYPKGLSPLIQEVNDLGMEFGLWLEPEMVNPDSDLYRAHPDWVLGTNSGPTILARHQLVLNLALKEVQEYLFEAIDALLREHPIGYLKWDMNRELHQAADQHGKAAVHRQTHNLYALLKRLRQAHPEVEIESCASGGGRADFGILQHTDRVWTSDSNDALDRLQIQKGFSLFFPSEIMGSHVGPFDCHITGRMSRMRLRSGVALFGHMGMEMNVLELDAAEKRELQAAIRLHKRMRPLIHSGNLVRLDTNNYTHAFGLVDEQQKEALFSYNLIDNHLSTLPAPLRFAGLDPDACYQLELVWPETVRSDTPSILDQLEGLCASGEALMYHGLQMPLIKPENLLLFHLQRVETPEMETTV